MKQMLRQLIGGWVRNVPTRYRNRVINLWLNDEVASTIKQLKHANVIIANTYDIGAYRGDWTKKLSGDFPHMKFFMFEANSIHEDQLKKTGNWYKVGILSDVEREVEFYTKGGTGDSYYKENTSIYEDVSSQKMTTQTLDGIVEKSNIPFPDFLKLDTQGSELDVLRGAKNCLNFAKMVLMECPVYPYNKNSPELADYVNFMLGNGFYPARCSELHNLAGVLCQIDIIFIRKDILQEFNSEFKNFYNIH